MIAIKFHKFTTALVTSRYKGQIRVTRSHKKGHYTMFQPHHTMDACTGRASKVVVCKAATWPHSMCLTQQYSQTNYISTSIIFAKLAS